MGILRFLFAAILLITLTKANPFARNVDVREKNDILSTENHTINYRMSKNVVPTYYHIDLVPNVVNGNFAGYTKIHITVLNTSTKTLVLHAKDLKLSTTFPELHDKHGYVSAPIHYHLNETTDFLTLEFRAPIVPGNYTLHVKYTGVLNEDSIGFYRTSYTNEQNEKVWLAATNFKPIRARQAFPCFDEPSMKAKFEIFINHWKNYTAISNVPVLFRVVDKMDSDKVWTKFAVTPSMSTYQVAFVVSNSNNFYETYERLVHHVQGSHKISVDLQNVILCAGIRTANASTWNKVFDVYETSRDPSERAAILKALGCSADPNILMSYLTKTLDARLKIPRKDVIKAVYSGSDVGIEVAFDFIKENYQFIIKSDDNILTILSCLYDIASRMTIEAQHDKLERFIRSIKNNKDLTTAVSITTASTMTPSNTTVSTTTPSSTTVSGTTPSTTTPSTTTIPTMTLSSTTPSTTTVSTTTPSTTTVSGTTPSTTTLSITTLPTTTLSSTTPSTTIVSITSPSTTTPSSTTVSTTTPSTTTVSTTSTSSTTASSTIASFTTVSTTTPSSTTVSDMTPSTAILTTTTLPTTTLSSTTPSTTTVLITSPTTTPLHSTTTPLSTTVSTTTLSTATVSTTIPSSNTPSTSTSTSIHTLSFTILLALMASLIT